MVVGPCVGASQDQDVERFRQEWEEQYRRFRQTGGHDRSLSNSILAQTYARLFRCLAVTSSDHVLDICCGNGFSSNHLTHRYGCRAIGVDIAGEGIRLAALKASALGVSRRARFLMADVRALPFRGRPFTKIVACQALGFFAAPLPILRSLRELLAPSGELLVTDVAPGWYRSDPSYHHLTLPEWCEQLSAAGFSIKASGWFGLPLWRLLVKMTYGVSARCGTPAGGIGRLAVDGALRLAYGCTLIEQYLLERVCRGSHLWVLATRSEAE